jgi:hypothetical protein
VNGESFQENSFQKKRACPMLEDTPIAIGQAKGDHSRNRKNFSAPPKCWGADSGAASMRIHLPPDSIVVRERGLELGIESRAQKLQINSQCVGRALPRHCTRMALERDA